jgi:hypothetical protein
MILRLFGRIFTSFGLEADILFMISGAQNSLNFEAAYRVKCIDSRSRSAMSLTATL